MIQTTLFSPGSETKFLINQYTSLYSNTPVLINDKHIPRGDASLVFNLSGEVKIVHPYEIQLPPYFIGPNLLKSITIEASGIISSLIVTCKPSILSRILDIEIDLAPNELFKELPSHIFEPVWKNLKSIDEPLARVAYFEKFISEKINNYGPYIPDKIDYLYEKLLTDSINTHFCDIISKTGINPRSLRRNFKPRVGMSAKHLAMIIRLNYLWQKVDKENAHNYQDIVFEGGYFDQSHFIKDFKTIVGETPNHFFNRNLEKVKMITGR